MSEHIKQTALQEHERQRCEVWTRVMGYHRPVSEFNPGKQGEHHERRHFVEPCGKPASCG
ncbi:MAG: anaerobic ribonucleoside-triphosphate reductase [Betaproteobacteria bacterium]|nr:anaerobic ribonucleoside-triphosphate reductase [Betaproteobacteria bacterium]